MLLWVEEDVESIAPRLVAARATAVVAVPEPVVATELGPWPPALSVVRRAEVGEGRPRMEDLDLGGCMGRH